MATPDFFWETCVPKGLRDFKMPQVFRWDTSSSIISILWCRIHISWISLPLMVGTVCTGCHVCIMWAFSVTSSAVYVVSPWTSHHKVSVGVQQLIQTHTAVLENLPECQWSAALLGVGIDYLCSNWVCLSMRVNPEVLSNYLFCLALGQTATHKGHPGSRGHSCEKKLPLTDCNEFIRE